MGFRASKRPGAWPAVEGLEGRQFLSAAPAPVMPLRELATILKATEAKKAPAKKKHKASVTPVPTPVAWNDLVGTWNGTFTDNATRTPKPFSVTFAPRWIKSNTGTYNLAAMAGVSSALTTVTPDVYGNALVHISLKSGGEVSFVGAISRDGKIMFGRWSTHLGSANQTGIFQLARP